MRYTATTAFFVFQRSLPPDELVDDDRDGEADAMRVARGA
jgi:hypothetical protein